jgi:hypothetical protein
VIGEVDWLDGDRRFPGEMRLPDASCVIKVDARAELSDRCRRETRYYNSSAQLTAEQAAAAAVRGHWGIENRLHWVLDVVFKEDQSACVKVMEPKTWRSSGTSQSISSAPQKTSTTSNYDEKPPDGIRSISPSCSKPHRVNPDSGPCRRDTLEGYGRPQVSSRVRSALRLFQDPEFDAAQAARRSTHDKPQIISCAELSKKFLASPRGCFEYPFSI